jgi:hypothetical protein
MAEPNYSLLSDDDLYYIANNRWDLVSDDGLKYMSGEGFETSDVLLHQAGRAVTSTIRGIEKIVDIPGISVDEEQDAEDERRSRMMMETNPVTSVIGGIGGAIADPVILPGAVLAPIKGATAAITGLKKGVVAGTVYGAVEPVYEEYGDSRVLNTLVGAGFGGVLGGVVGKLFGGLSPNPKKLAQAESAATDAAIKAEKEGQIQLDAAGEAIDANNLNQGLAGKVVSQAQNPTKYQRLNRETNELEEVQLVSPAVDFNLPPQLRKAASPKFVGNKVQWDNDLDKALYIIGNRLKGHRAFVDWAKNVTGLDEAGVQALAKEVRDELNVSLPKAPMQGDTIIHTKSGAVDRVMTEQTTPKEVVTPFVPKGVEVKSVLNDDDVAVMENVLGLKPRGVGFVDVKTGRFVSAKTVDERLEKAGIQVQRAAPEGELGMPRQMPSVGAAGVRPQAVYGADLAGRVADVDAQEALMRTAAGQDIMEREAIRTSGKLVNIQRRAATKLKNSILKDHNDLADFIVKAKEEDRILSAEEIAAIKPLVEDALQHRMSVINEISEFVARGADLDSPEALRMAEDLLYYSGIHQFYLNQGTLASRSLNARKIVKRALDKKSPLKNIFPTVSC